MLTPDQIQYRSEQNRKVEFVYHTPHDNLDLFSSTEQTDFNFPRPKTLAEFQAVVLKDGRRLYKHQAENLLFFEREANFRGVCADDTGLGKTITACALLHEFPEKLLPALIVCKSTLKVQWFVELLSACDIVAQVIHVGTQIPSEDKQAWIFSYDMMKRFDIEQLSEVMKPNLVILDECQAIKNWESKRAKSIINFLQGVPYVIGTSADPISNDALEYYTMLHAARPLRFDNQAALERMCDFRQTTSGGFKRGGISKWHLEQWREMTKDIIVRHNREDVMPDLPTVVRSHRFVEIENESDNSAINQALTEFVEAYDTAHDYDKESATMSYNDARMKANTSLMRLWHLIGNAKVSHALDYIESFLNEGDLTRKLTVFVHHKSVAQGILDGIEKLRSENKITCNPPFIIRGGMNEHERNDLVMKCTMNGGWPTNDPFDRLLVASTLAAGEGINLQKCYDCLMVERQFNPPREEQAFGRFSRIGIAKGISNIFAVYLSAIGTLDEWFNNLVETKRDGLKRTHGDKEEYGSQWGAEDEIVTDLMDEVAKQARKIIKKIKRS